MQANPPDSGPRLSCGIPSQPFTRRLSRDWVGQGLAEYPLLVAAIVGLVVAVCAFYPPRVQSLVQDVGAYIGDQAPREAGLGVAPRG